MAEEPPGRPPSGGMVSGLIDRVLNYIDSPFKLAAVVVLAVIGLTGYFVWERRVELAEAIIEDWTNPHLKAEVFTSKFATQLMTDTRADLSVLAEVSLKTNLIKDIGGFARNDPGWIPPSNPRPLFYAARDPQLLISLIEGHPTCRDIDPTDGEEQHMLLRLNMKRRCYIAVPPLLASLAGGLMLAWQQPLGAEAEVGAMRVMYQAATKLATW